MRILAVVALFLCSVETALGFFGLTTKFNTHDEPFIPHLNRGLGGERLKVIREKYIKQRVDNFNPQDNRLWEMRYFENDEFRQPNSPIFIYVGGEWTISAGSIAKGTHIYELAKENNGTLFYTEHRYYGKSHPTKNTTTENLRFLTVDQALADLAFFITHIKASSPDFTNSGVVMVGGSYSGRFRLFTTIDSAQSYRVLIGIIKIKSLLSVLFTSSIDH
jgi:Serine carboxypeptidase S28